MGWISLESAEAYADFVRGPEMRARLEHEAMLVRGRTGAFSVSGLCWACEAPGRFQVNLPERPTPGATEPNWRESLTCERCGLWSRLRAVVEAYRREAPSPGTGYVTEQVTSFCRFLDARCTEREWIGSEYLDASHSGGIEVGGVRHEDLANLSFASSSFDVILSNDVLEHVAHPRAAIAEMA